MGLLSAHSAQIFEGFQRLRNHMLWLFTQLPVEARIVVGVHAALESLGIIGPIEEACGDAQRDSPARRQAYHGLMAR